MSISKFSRPRFFDYYHHREALIIIRHLNYVIIVVARHGSLMSVFKM